MLTFEASKPPLLSDAYPRSDGAPKLNNPDLSVCEKIPPPSSFRPLVFEKTPSERVLTG